MTTNNNIYLNILTVDAVQICELIDTHYGIIS